jgi:pimeloyl-ACP methyl ester carboxylesterase
MSLHDPWGRGGRCSAATFRAVRNADPRGPERRSARSLLPSRPTASPRPPRPPKAAAARRPLRRRWTVVGDAVIHDRETLSAAPSGSRPILLLHGVGTTTRYHRPLLRELAGRVPAVAPELPGIGASSAEHLPETIADQADVLAAWLRRTGWHPRAVVGNSMGAQTAVELAVRHPALVDHLVLLGPTVDRDSRSLPRQVGELLVDATVERPSLLLITVTDSVLTRRRAVNRYVEAALEHRIEDRLAAVRAPVLVVRGERDVLAPRAWIRELAAAAPDGRIAEVPRAGHACHHGRPAAVADLLVRATSR